MSTAQQFNTIDRLRLEVEVDPGGPYNLINNSNGDYGGWGWITPVATATMRSLKQSPTWVLIYKSPTTSVPSYFYSEATPISPGQYASASITVLAITGFYRVKIEWLDSGLAVIGSSTQSAYATVSGADSLTTIAPSLAPANTSFMRLRVDHYSTNAGANPAANAEITFNQARLAKGASSAALSTSRTNLLPNPSFEVNANGWSASTGCTIGRTTAAVVIPGTASLAMTCTGTAGATANTGILSVTAGRDYVFAIHGRGAATARAPKLTLEFLDTANKVLLRVDRTFGVMSTSNFRRYDILGTAPANAARVRCFFGVTSSAVNEVHYWDQASLTEGRDLAQYFDGSFTNAGTKSYAWTGTAHDSPSTMTDTSLASMSDSGWQNILGPTREIQVDREELNLGTLSATVLDAALDPSQSSQLRPGRKVRLTVLDDTTGIWEPLFTGKSNKLEVEYDEKADPPRPPRVILAAVDGTQTLANARRPEGVATIAELPYILEGAGVPWKVNNSSAHVASATTVSINDNASALDQIAITRDSVLGAAWVDRYGVLVARSVTPTITLPNTSFDPTASGWYARANTTIAQSTSAKVSGTYSLRMTANAAGNIGATTAVGTASYPVTPGGQYTGSVWVRANTTGGNGRQVRLNAAFYTAGGTLMYSSIIAAGNSSNTTWTQITSAGVDGVPVTVPEGAAYMAVYVEVLSAASGEAHFIDDISLQVFNEGVNVPLDESVYSDLDIAFSTDDCINSVMVKYLRFKPADGSTEEVMFGPYENRPSIEEWGRRTAEFTVHGIAEGGLASYATSILARSATPSVAVNSVRIAIKSDTTIKHALWDLGNAATVVNAEKGISHALRVNRVSHTITPTKWMVELGFTGANSVASPQATPPVQNTALAVDSGWQDVSFLNGWVNFDSTRTMQYRRLNGWVHFRGLMRNGTVGSPCFQLPAGFRPVNRGSTSEHHFGVPGNGVFANIQVWHNGDVVVTTQLSNMWIDLSGIRYEVGA